jgi:hypothetical protein
MATEVSGSDEAVVEVSVDAVATADTLAAIVGAGCGELDVASIAVLVLLVAAAVSGFPLASLAAIVTVAGLPAVPPITSLP